MSKLEDKLVDSLNKSAPNKAVKTKKTTAKKSKTVAKKSTANVKVKTKKQPSSNTISNNHPKRVWPD